MNKIGEQRLRNTQASILETIKSSTLTHEQKVTKLASLADSLVDVMDYLPGLFELMDEKAICDLSEGHAPVRPRYIVPNYQQLLDQGCTFLRLDPVDNLSDALNNLLIMYKHVPSITNFPVYIGNLDTLLEPYVKQMDRKTAKKELRRFLNHIDRTITDSFCHGNIGPEATITGEIILELEKELENTVPNLSIKYDPTITPKEFARKAIITQLQSAKPSFANHQMFKDEFHGDYAIASCYNGLYIGGGSYTLVRALLGHASQRASSIDDFMTVHLPFLVKTMLAYMDQRIKFMVEDSGFFTNNFLAKEGFIQRDRFTAMFGIVGLAQCVNHLLELDGKDGRFGADEAADQLGVRIIAEIHRMNEAHTNPYCEATDGHFLLHGQVGISSDEGQTPNCRIPIGEEPEQLSDHILHCGLFHKYFPSGIGEIFMVEPTATANPDYALDIIDNAFKSDVRYLSIHNSDSDLIRVTGYLAKKSEIEKLDRNEAVLHDTTALGKGQRDNGHIFERKVR